MNTSKQKIKADLQFFYDHEAQKYYETRKKHRDEGETVLEILNNRKSTDSTKKVRILELWSWSGRFANFLRENYKGKFEYVWVDMSGELIKYAEKENKQRSFAHDDMLHFLEEQDQESFDVVVWFASVQHLTSYQERLLLMKYVYRVLKYDGIFLMINWSLSKRFIRKYWKVILSSIGQIFISFGKHNWRDLMIPWKNGKKKYMRFYHLFGIKELKKLALFSGFNLQEVGFLTKGGELVGKWGDAKNSLLVVRKQPIHF